MAEFTITIKDDSSSVSIGLNSAGESKTTAFFVAQALIRLVPEVVQGAARAAAKHGNCPCTECTAKRAALAEAQADPKPTLH
ncbi:hypothetical protein D9M70_518600 [compost metagenome]